MRVQEEGNIQMGIPPKDKTFIVDGHTRRGSVFRLLKRVLDKINE